MISQVLPSPLFPSPNQNYSRTRLRRRRRRVRHALPSLYYCNTLARYTVAASSPEAVFNLLRVSVGNIISEISARLLELPLGIQESSAALVRALRHHHHHHTQPLSVASAVGSIIFLRCVVPYAPTTFPQYVFVTIWPGTPSTMARATLRPSGYL